jgi:sugar lactone lactonase YvrE
LAVTISGLPAGTNAGVTVAGPSNFNQVVATTQTLTGLTPGNYTVTANNVTRAPYSYGGTVAGSPATVSTSAGANATVTYAAVTGAIQLNVTGTPAGTNPNVMVTGPGGFTQVVSGSQVLGTLVPGTYAMTVNQVRASGSIVDQVYGGAGGSAAVAAGATATGAVTYSLVAGTGKLWVARTSGAIVGYDSSQLATSGAPTPSVTLATDQVTQAVVFDRAHDAWTVDQNDGSGSLSRFTPSQLASSASPTPEVTISSPSLTGPLGMAFDASNNAWVANVNQNTLIQFTPAQLASSGGPTANVRISASGDSLSSPAVPAFDRAGNLWVPNQTSNKVVMFSPAQVSSSGSPVPAVILSSDSLYTPVGLAFDSANNLWVSNYLGNTVVMFTPAQRASSGTYDPAVVLTVAAFDNPSCMAFDNGGNLWVVNARSGVLLKLTPAQIASSGSPTATTTITGLGTEYPSLGWCSFSPAPAAVPLAH